MLVRLHIFPLAREDVAESIDGRSAFSFEQISLISVWVKHHKNVNIFELLSFGMPVIASRQEVVRQVPGSFDVISDEIVARGSKVGFGLSDLKVRLQSVK